MKVLVTGASSLLARRTAEALLARGDDVTVLQRNQAPLDCRQVLADVRDADAVMCAVDGSDAVIHAAAKVGVVGSWEDYRSINVDGTANVMAAARFHGVSRVVYVSTPSVAHAGHSLVG
ncbi:MAG: NAD-dependent epimerase/dehydratase family protein, partial [Ilumatobacteraceae bacterium]|nr:NAD-dependent epimerase/dehydratase family protein [Ilumatobacteraceae bacterium]